MANSYAQGTFEPYIPASLFTDADLEIFDALGISHEPVGKNGDIYLYHENYCTSGWMEAEDGTDKEIGEDDLYGIFQEVIKKSAGKILWISHEQAYTCDKMRSSEFGGSAVFITADDIQYCSTSNWLSNKIGEIEISQSCPNP